MRTTKKILALALAAAVLPGCGGDDKSGRYFDPTPEDVSAKAVFDPSAGASGIPFPIDLLFAGTADRTINIPDKLNTFDAASADVSASLTAATSTPVAAAMADPQTSVNTMDGWSNTAPMVVRFSANIAGPADQNDDGLPDGVRIFQTSVSDPGANFGNYGPITELRYGVDFVAGPNGSSLLIIPVAPFRDETTFLISIDNNLKTTTGEAVTADDTFSLVNGAYQLEAAISGLPGILGASSDFVREDDGDPCNFNLPASVAVCTDVNTESYQLVADNIPPAAEGALGIVAALAGLEAEAAGDLSTLFLLEQLRRIASLQLSTIEAAPGGPDASDVVLVYSVTTQNVGDALDEARDAVLAAAAPTIDVLNPVGLWAGDTRYAVTSPGPDGDLTTTDDYLAHVYLGTLDGMLQFVDPTDANNTVWEADRSPGNWNAGGLGGLCSLLPAAATGSSNLGPCNDYAPEAKVTDYSVPVLISTPRIESINLGLDPDDDYVNCDAGTYPSGLPVVIYQHGITSNRASLLAIADTLAQACIVGIAIDLPKHGILPENDPFGASQLAQLQMGLQSTPVFSTSLDSDATLERLTQVSSPLTGCSTGTGDAIGSNFYCPSGDNFINLANLANSRDTFRQGVVDLSSLLYALKDGGPAALAADIGTLINTDNIHFAGVSLGGEVGSVFVAQEPTGATGLVSATLNVMGGNISKLLDGSPSFGPRIADGLYASGGIAKPSADYEGFMILAQAHVDNTDPINFAADLNGGTPILMHSVVGDGNNIACLVDGDACPDQVVPNNVFGSSFGLAWGTVDRLVNGEDLRPASLEPTQRSFLPGQDFFTTPVALAGTDPFAQGTNFVGLNALYDAGEIRRSTVNGTGLSDNFNVLGSAFGRAGFDGVGLREADACGDTGSRIVRFTDGEHSSMLRPDVNVNTTLTMQTQLAGFVVSNGTVVAPDWNLNPSNPDADPSLQVVRLGGRSCP